ncbi:hypothetical protein [Actinomycetospora chibensis]|uniref:Uncharacterized protein n=1 Tax=Actinomycetospora chibensis TaxID=663606 RepID=A0ABV9RDB2_9PSEU|nr:hypothetical protein [Actinomycetospora chibensis]MDD7925008.1 hypothetical protein [Actinomycetospora chibensis]
MTYEVMTGLDFSFESQLPPAVVRQAIEHARPPIVAYGSDESGPMRPAYRWDDLVQAVHDLAASRQAA